MSGAGSFKHLNRPVYRNQLLKDALVAPFFLGARHTEAYLERSPCVETLLQCQSRSPRFPPSSTRRRSAGSGPFHHLPGATGPRQQITSPSPAVLRWRRLQDRGRRGPLRPVEHRVSERRQRPRRRDSVFALSPAHLDDAVAASAPDARRAGRNGYLLRRRSASTSCIWTTLRSP